MVHIGIIPDGNRRWCKKNYYDINNIIEYYEKLLIEFIKKNNKKKKYQNIFKM